MRFSPIILIILLLALLLVACGGTPVTPPSPAPASALPTVSTTGAAVTLNVFAAASLIDAFNALAPAFAAAHPGVKIVYNFAGSQQLATQLAEGAPADVFASANQQQMNSAIASTRVISGSAQILVRNRLVLITPSDNPAGVTTLKDLAKPGLKLLLADRAVPAGQYTLELLGRASALPEYTANYSPTVLAHVVSYEQNVRSVLSKIELGEGDAAIVYTTDAAQAGAKLQQIAIPDALNSIATYMIAPVADSAAPELAKAFVAYVLSPQGQQVLRQYGFIPVGPE